MTSSWQSQSTQVSPWLVSNIFNFTGLSNLPDNTLLLTSQGFIPVNSNHQPIDTTIIKRIKWRQNPFGAYFDGHFENGKCYLWREDVPKPLLGNGFQILIFTKNNTLAYLDFNTSINTKPVPDSMTVTLNGASNTLQK